MPVLFCFRSQQAFIESIHIFMQWSQHWGYGPKKKTLSGSSGSSRSTSVAFKISSWFSSKKYILYHKLLHTYINSDLYNDLQSLFSDGKKMCVSMKLYTILRRMDSWEGKSRLRHMRAFFLILNKVLSNSIVSPWLSHLHMIFPMVSAQLIFCQRIKCTSTGFSVS